MVITLPQGTITKIPLQDTGACVVAGPHGDAYIGTHTGRLLRFTPGNMTLEPVMPPLDGESLLTGFAGANGKLYFGTTPGGIVVEYDPQSGSAGQYYYWRSDQQHPRHAYAFANLPDGRVAAFLSGGSAPSLLLIAPDGGSWQRTELSGIDHTEEIRSVVPLDADTLLLAVWPGRRLLRFNVTELRITGAAASLPNDDSPYCLQPIDGQVIASGLSGSLYQYCKGAWEWLGTPIPDDPPAFTPWRNECIAGITYHGRLLFSTTDRRMYTVSALPMREAHGLAISAMGMSPDRKLYVGFARNMRLGCWDPEEEVLDERFVAAPFPGEVSALGFAGERLLIGFADTCGVMAYYPELPYRFSQNPRFLGCGDDEPRRPIGPMVHHESNVYFAAAAVRHTGEGAIIRINPLENDVTAFPGIIPKQNLTSVIADRLSGLLVAGGSIREGKDAAPAHLGFWSPYEERTTRLVTPFADANMLCVWAAESGRIYVTDGEARLAILSSAGDVLETVDFPLGRITALITNQAGELYGLAGGWFFHLDAEHECIERLTEATGYHLTEVRRGLFAFTDAGKIFTVQLW